MKQTQHEKDKYKKLVEQVSPKNKIVPNTIKAFFVGGTICVIGELITNFFVKHNYNIDDSKLITTIILIFLGVLLTGLGIYEKIGKFAGGGSIIPITGFANSVAAPSIEFKKEGFVYGVGARMFIVAGPVILYGTVTSVIVGLVYYFVNYLLWGVYEKNRRTVSIN